MKDRKEILTDKHIAEDLRSDTKPWNMLVIIVCVAVLGWLFHWFFSLRNPSVSVPRILELAEVCVEAAYFLILVGLFVCEAVRLARWRRVAAKGNYQVLTDTLVAAEDSLDSMSSYDLNEHGQSYYLYFSSFGKYFVGNRYRQFYRWSKTYAMGVRGMMTYATPGDTYYIVTDNNKTILYVYNTKLFEYRPEA